MSEPAQVSVIIPCYHCSNTIGRALASVVAQTLKPAEVILVDDCSKDATLAMLYRLQTEYGQDWVKVIPSPVNAGPGTARNIGWAAATQPYIAFLDADDAWHPQKIEIQYSWMIKHPEAALTGHACQQWAKTNSGAPSYSVNDDSAFTRVSKNTLLLSNRFFTRSVMLQRAIEQRFVEGKRYCEDYQLWLEMGFAGLACYRSNLPLAYLFKADYGESGLSASLWKMQKGELEAYRHIYKLKEISLLQLMGLYLWSNAKYAKRVAVSTVGNAFKAS
ncbi:glycosyltransferase family 2 protein [Halopseudomonas pelagia]|uniref:glycosyltransferase family 2 protein n=1 Tax=Halopseudomonas pelagia TaxID=553151 RepID=UPI0030DAAF94|tara:strand:+ start:7340 stop:8164 length:825 start_codon:yes stop_codon:yes gene_type:complete